MTFDEKNTSYYQKKRRSLLNDIPLTLHDKASCHKSESVTSLLKSYEWDVLPHPAYSTDMSLPDFDHFPKLKEPLRVIRFDDLDELEAGWPSRFDCLTPVA